MGNTTREERMLEVLGIIANVICAVKAVADTLRDIYRYWKQNSNRPPKE